jgi:hypothetical protein
MRAAVAVATQDNRGLVLVEALEQVTQEATAKQMVKTRNPILVLAAAAMVVTRPLLKAAMAALEL